MIDIGLASIPDEEITTEIIHCTKADCSEMEKYYIEQDEPIYNQRLNPQSRHNCRKCNKEYKSRGSLAKHERDICKV